MAHLHHCPSASPLTGHNPVAKPPKTCSLLAEQFRTVASHANNKKVETRIADMKAWRQLLAQFVPMIIQECRNYADAGKYECQISLSMLLAANRYSAAFPEKRVVCWQCKQGDEQEYLHGPVLRGCYFSTQPETVVDAPATFDFDVTNFVNAVFPVVVTALEIHGFTVHSLQREFNVACVHLAMFTPTKNAPDLLVISWNPDGERDDKLPKPMLGGGGGSGGSPGNLIMSCGVCHEDRPMQSIIPCGHLVCKSCWATSGASGLCPYCRGHAFSVNPLFVP